MKMEEGDNSKFVKVQCSFCGKEIDCPEEMLKTSKKHMCYDCFQKPENVKKLKGSDVRNIHVDVPLEDLADTVADNFANAMVDEAFPQIWNKEKENLRELSKKDLSREMFGAGVYLGIQAFIDSMHSAEESENAESSTT